MKRHAIGAAAALALLFAATPAAADGAISIKNFDFAPMTLTVRAGETVTWRNDDEEPHTVVSLDGLFRSAAMDGGESFSFRFDKPGTYKYLCSIHPRMTGAIVVK
ncbi:MAG TPA: cupredoxin family copper-binding protein [Rhizomicrobium sp.]|jgi:plastocyanin|nr:cupredoxin family copper-binding protein [Rhizomicrobium sp.]